MDEARFLALGILDLLRRGLHGRYRPIDTDHDVVEFDAATYDQLLEQLKEVGYRETTPAVAAAE